MNNPLDILLPEPQVPTSMPNSRFRNRQLHLVGRLYDSIAHDLMNGLTKAVLGIDSGDLEMTRKAVYQTAGLLQELQQLGFSPNGLELKKVPLNRLVSSAILLAQGLLRERQIAFIEILRDSTPVDLHSQVQMITLLELILLAADCQQECLPGSLRITIDGNQRLAWTTLQVTGPSLNFDKLESETLEFARSLVHMDQGDLTVGKTPLSFEITVTFPRSTRSN